MTQIEKRRKLFFMGISALATSITLVSASATFTINEKSFTDWGEWASPLAGLATAGIEATFALTLYGVTYALTGPTEKKFGVALLLGTVAIMATNYVTHHMTTTGVALDQWQINYIQWIGPLALFAILLLIVGIIVYNHDSQKRTLERDFAFAAERKAMEWKQSQLDSAAFDQHMAQYKEQVFEEARQKLRLNAQPARAAIGFVTDEADPKAESNLD